MDELQLSFWNRLSAREQAELAGWSVEVIHDGQREAAEAILAGLPEKHKHRPGVGLYSWEFESNKIIDQFTAVINEYLEELK